MRVGRIRLLAACVLGLVLALAFAGNAFAADHWKDISDADWISNYGVTASQAATVAEGYPDGTFRPGQAVTRQQFAKMAVSGLDLPTANPVTPTFSDVPKTNVDFYPFVEGAYKAGIVSGFPGKLFKPTLNISRQQANSMMGRFLSEAELDAHGLIKGEVLSYSSLLAWYNAEGNFYLASYTDASQLAADHQATTAYLVYHEVVLGSNNKLMPTASLSRAQAVAMVLRTLDALDEVANTNPPDPPEDLETIPESPSSTNRPLLLGTCLPEGIVAVYDTFGGTTTQIAQGTADDEGNFSIRIPNVPVAPPTPVLAEGLHTIKVKVKDSYDRVSDYSDPLQYRVDTTGPTGEITEPEDEGASKESKPAFEVTAADAGSGVKSVSLYYREDGEDDFILISTDTTTPYAAAWGTKELDQGEYNFKAEIEDWAGNKTTLGPIDVTIDTTAPTVTLDLPAVALGHTYAIDTTGHPQFIATATDAGTVKSGPDKIRFSYRLDNPGATFTTLSEDTDLDEGVGVAVWGTTVLSPGIYEFAVEAFDKAGNVSAAVKRQVRINSTLKVTAVNPGAGPAAGGNEVVITGSGFVGVTAVRFGSTLLATDDYTVDSQSQITVTDAPAGTVGTSVRVRVTAEGQDTPDDNPASYYSYGAPTVTDVEPGQGSPAGGTSVVITGTGFTGLSGAGAVKFGTTNATSYTVNSHTQITATAPAGDEDEIVDIRVQNAAGTSANTAADDYHYVTLPSVTGVSPGAGPPAGGTTVTITGTGFSTAPATGAVKFGTTVATYTVNSATQITATSPAHDAGTVHVTVTTPAGTSEETSADQFNYGSPTISSLSPGAGSTTGGTTVVITGTGFAGTSGADAVKFDTTNATSYTVNSGTQITATAPAHAAGTVYVTVTNNTLTSAATASSQFSYGVPDVTSVSPGAGAAAGGNSVVITGARFTGLSGPGAVKFGAVNATSYVVTSPTSITAVVPAGTTGTSVHVTVTTGAGTSSASDADLYTYGPPTVTGLLPSTGSAGDLVIINGTGFTEDQGDTAVEFDGVDATTFTINSPNQITAQVPAGTGTVDVIVTTGGGESAVSAASKFTYE